MKVSARPGPSFSGRGRRFAVVVARFNGEITENLWSACRRTLLAAGTREEDVRLIRVPGAFELPLVCRYFAKTGKYDAVIALGCVIRGETPHDTYISQETARGLGQAALDAGVPVIFGVLTPLNLKQAKARSGKGPQNKGTEAALAALEMAELVATEWQKG